MGNFKRLDRGAAENIAKLDHNALLAELVKLAEAKVGLGSVDIHCFEIGISYNLKAGPAKGACLVKNSYFKGIRLYYGEVFAGLVVMAHEVGHLYTMEPDDLNKYQDWHNVFGYERLASRWALAWLRERLDEKELARAERMLNIWLDSYYDAYNFDEAKRQYVHAGERVREEVNV